MILCVDITRSRYILLQIFVLMERENYRRKGKRGEKDKNNVVIIRI